MQKIIDTLPNVQSFELHPELDIEGIHQKFLELIEEHKQSVGEKIQNTNIPKLIPVVGSFEIIEKIFENGGDYYNYLGETSYDIFGYSIIGIWAIYFFSSLASLEIKRLGIPIGNYGKCILRNSDNTIEFHVSGISEISKQLKKESNEEFEEIGKEIANEEYKELLKVISKEILRKKFNTKLKEQLIEKITDDIVALCLQCEVLKECKIDKIELKSYLLQDESVQIVFLEVLSKKLAENNIQIQEDFIQNLGQYDLEWYKKIMLMGKADGLKNTDRYFESSSNFFIRMFQIKGGFNFLVSFGYRILKIIIGGIVYSIPFNDTLKKGKKRLQKTTQFNIDFNKISHKYNT